jgi:polysaccharide biosynthesis/export protein
MTANMSCRTGRVVTHRGVMFATGSLWLLLAATGFAQEPLPLEKSAGQPAGQPASEQSQVRDPNYRVGPADVLTVRVLGVDDYRQATVPWIDVTVSNSGKVSLPYLGILKVAGMTAAQIESAITAGLRQRDLVKDPQVAVGVQAYRSNTVYILGEVAQPGQYYMRDEMHVMDLIALSMGTPNEGTMYLYRRVPVEETGEQQDGEGTSDTKLAAAIPIDIQELAAGKRPELNLELQSGDILYVPLNRPNYYFVSGDVLNPGSFEMPPRRELAISEALAFAGGLSKTAKGSKGILVRYDEQGGRQELPVDFQAILNGKKPNFTVMPNDIIFIPGSPAKTFTQAFVKYIPTLALLALF